MFTKDGVIKTLRELRAMHPQISFTANTPAELGWSPYTPPPYVPTQEELDRSAARSQLEIDRTAALAYMKLATLADMSPSQIQAWVDGNVTNLATAQDAIKTLAIGLSILIRREKLSNI